MNPDTARPTTSASGSVLMSLAVVCVLAMGCQPPSTGRDASVAAADTLRLLVYNIHHAEGMDLVTDLDRIAHMILELDADVVALQEVDSVVTRTGGIDQAAVLGELTGMTPVFGRFMPYQGGAYGMAVLSGWPVVESTNLRLPDGLEPRSSVVATLESPSGRLFRLADVHFYESEAERLAQATALHTYLAQDSIPTIMAGDFNSTPGSAVMEYLGAGWSVLDKGEDRMTFSSFEPVREIDFVLLRPAAAFGVIAHRPLDEPVISDHRPVWAELRLGW